MSAIGGEAAAPAPGAGHPTEIEAQRAAARAEAFGYVCNRCSRCCQGKLIQVNPYEIARLARALGLSTAAFTERWTEDGAGGRLARREDDSCVFLGPEGCGVHADRPLVCRIYPLGRHVAASGAERWAEVTPHPQTKGVYSKSGTVADYIAAQGAYPFMQAADDYTAWLRRAYAVVGEAGDDDDPFEAADLLDMDGVLAAHCARTGADEPLDMEARMALHLAILTARLDEIEGETR